jgi:signal transduction histidine kinase
VTLDVHNRGAPIPAGLVPLLFEPFRRGDGRAGQKSLGLGLNISWQIVTAHGGVIDVRSPDGDGTTFSVWLPRRAGERAAAARA